MKLQFMILLSLAMGTNSCRTNAPITHLQPSNSEKRGPTLLKHVPLNLTEADTVDFTVTAVDFGANKAPKIEIGDSAYDLYFYKVCTKGSKDECTFGIFTQDVHFAKVAGTGAKEVYLSPCNLQHRSKDGEVTCSETWSEPKPYKQEKPQTEGFAAVIGKVEHNALEFLDLGLAQDALFRGANEELGKCEVRDPEQTTALEAMIAQGPVVLADNLRLGELTFSKQEGLSLTTRDKKGLGGWVSRRFSGAATVLGIRGKRTGNEATRVVSAEIDPPDESRVLAEVERTLPVTQTTVSTNRKLPATPVPPSDVLQAYAGANSWTQLVAHLQTGTAAPTDMKVVHQGPKGARFVLFDLQTGSPSDLIAATKSANDYNARNPSRAMDFTEMRAAYVSRSTAVTFNGEQRYLIFIADQDALEEYRQAFPEANKAPAKLVISKAKEQGANKVVSSKAAEKKAAAGGAMMDEITRKANARKERVAAGEAPVVSEAKGTKAQQESRPMSVIEQLKQKQAGGGVQLKAAEKVEVKAPEPEPGSLMGMFQTGLKRMYNAYHGDDEPDDERGSFSDDEDEKPKKPSDDAVATGKEKPVAKPPEQKAPAVVATDTAPVVPKPTERKVAAVPPSAVEQPDTKIIRPSAPPLSSIKVHPVVNRTVSVDPSFNKGVPYGIPVASDPKLKGSSGGFGFGAFAAVAFATVVGTAGGLVVTKLTSDCSDPINAELQEGQNDITQAAEMLRLERLALFLYLENEYTRARGW